jgi:hypothetical protein
MNVFRTLQEDWHQIASRPDAVAGLARWRRSEVVLEGFVNLGQVLDEIQHRGDADRSCRLLASLLRQAGDPLAARAVLQAVLPGLAATLPGHRRIPVPAPGVPRHAHQDRAHQDRAYQDMDADIVACAWEEIRGRAGQSLDHPARAVIGSARRRLRTWQEAQRRLATRTVVLDIERHAPIADLEWTRDPAERLAALLVAAVETGRLPHVQARLVFATSVAGLSAADVGTREGLPPRAIYFALGKAQAAFVRVCA